MLAGEAARDRPHAREGPPDLERMGSSAASAAAGALAAGLLLGIRDRAALLGPALLGEHVADGSWHGDNVFASLLGGSSWCRPRTRTGLSRP